MKKESLIWGSGILILFSIFLISAIGSSNYNVSSVEFGSGGNASSNNYVTGVVIGSIGGNTSSTNYAIQLGFYGSNANITSDTYNITLNTGWNLISLPLRQNSTVTNVSIALVEDGWNLISSSNNESIDFSEVYFTNSSGDEMTWDQAVINNHVKAYLSYYDSSAAQAVDRKYKYAAAAALGVDDSTIDLGKGYWLYSNDAGNLSMPGRPHPGGGTTFALANLIFNNGSEEKNFANAYLADWVEFPQYYDPSTGFQVESTNLNSSIGYFFHSNFDNVTLIRQN